MDGDLLFSDEDNEQLDEPRGRRSGKFEAEKTDKAAEGELGPAGEDASDGDEQEKNSDVKQEDAPREVKRGKSPYPQDKKEPLDDWSPVLPEEDGRETIFREDGQYGKDWKDFVGEEIIEEFSPTEFELTKEPDRGFGGFRGGRGGRGQDRDFGARRYDRPERGRGRGRGNMYRESRDLSRESVGRRDDRYHYESGRRPMGEYEDDQYGSRMGSNGGRYDNRARYEGTYGAGAGAKAAAGAGAGATVGREPLREERYGRDRYNVPSERYERDRYERGGYERGGYERGGYERDRYERDRYERDHYERAPPVGEYGVGRRRSDEYTAGSRAEYLPREAESRKRRYPDDARAFEPRMPVNDPPRRYENPSRFVDDRYRRRGRDYDDVAYTDREKGAYRDTRAYPDDQQRVRRRESYPDEMDRYPSHPDAGYSRRETEYRRMPAVDYTRRSSDVYQDPRYVRRSGTGHNEFPERYRKEPEEGYRRDYYEPRGRRTPPRDIDGM